MLVYMFGRVTIYSIMFIAVASVGILVSHVIYFKDLQRDLAGSVVLHEPTELTTDTWGIFDPKTGEIIEGNNTHSPRPIASVTKLFTAYAALESDKREEPTTITWADLGTEGRAGKLYYGEKTTPEALLFPLLIESSNDAGEAIKRTLGREFSDSIDQVKNELALEHTTIVDASGLSAHNVSEVSDLARFYSYVRKTHPHIIDITQLRMYISEDAGLINNNPARTLESFTGGKHGYTDEAGRTFVGTFTVTPDGKEVGVVLLGSKDLLKDINATLAYAKSSL